MVAHVMSDLDPGTCTECGTAPAVGVDHSHICRSCCTNYCPYCNEKKGNSWDHKWEIDQFKLRDLVGNELARKILKECKTW
jgi:hypothetical protein